MMEKVTKKMGFWLLMLMMAFSWTACSDDDADDVLNPPTEVKVALEQLYPSVQNIEWEVEGNYYVADCWLNGFELEVWFDANANWVMTEKDLNSVDQLPLAVREAFQNSNYYNWVVSDVDIYTYPQKPTAYVIEVKQGGQRSLLSYTEEGGLLPNAPGL